MINKNLNLFHLLNRSSCKSTTSDHRRNNQ